VAEAAVKRKAKGAKAAEKAVAEVAAGVNRIKPTDNKHNK
jgi:hypothetical protein